MKTIKFLFKRYFIDAMGAMALGLFSSLIIGLIISQIAKIPYLDFLSQLTTVVAASSPVVGSAIGVAIAWGMKTKPLVIFTSAVTGAVGYVAGGPVGAYIGAVVGAEVGNLVAGKTKVDIVITPMVTILSGGIVGILAGPYISALMTSLGSFVNDATELNPIPMGIIVAVVVGLVLTAPISSAALCIMINISGIAAGAAAVGCCCQMVGFAVASYKDNGFGGLLSQGLGTSMLQFPNIMKKPTIWIAPTLASAILGPISTVVLGMTNTSYGAGMGTSGLVGQFGALEAMGESMSMPIFLIQILIMHFIAPAALTLAFDFILRKIGWIKTGDMKLYQV
ncbi:MAG: sugar transporter subunit [Clostridia bacterium]|jgi:uncharacterized membrane protein|nr:sugar transporter subunit [Clostridia bacterium]